MRMHRIGGLFGCTTPFHIISQEVGFSKNVIEQTICLYIVIENSSYFDAI
jgi:hypothetical protein